MNCAVSPLGMLALGGVIWMDTSVAGVTVSATAGDVTPLRLAWILVLPTAAAEASPLVPALSLMLATAGLEEDQFTTEVRFCVEPSEKLPVAMNCSVTPFAMLAIGGVS